MDKQNIALIACYETKILFRDWCFKFIAFLAVVLVVLLHLMVQSDFNNPTWGAISLVSSIPYANTYLINYIQIFTTIFWAGRYLFHSKRLDSIDAIRVHPYNNTEHLLGKALGFLFVMIILDILLASSGMFVHLFLSSSPWAFYPYVFYFFTLTFPNLLFITGLTLWIKSLLRHQALALFVLCILFFLEVVYGTKFLHGGLDLFASFLPNMFSELTGFSGWGLYLIQRTAFLFWGIGLLFLCIRLSRRQPNKEDNLHLQGIGIALLIPGILTAWTYNSTFSQEKQARITARQTFVKYEKTPKIKITDHHVSFKQNDQSFSATSKITLLNPHEETLSSFILYLNPSLEIEKITSESGPIPFHRENQIIVLHQPLQSQEKQNIQIHYAGRITQETSYPEIENLDDFKTFRTYSFFNYGMETFFLQKNFTLLTPECQWYPASHPTVNVLSPYTSPITFTLFSLDVIGEKKRIAISQGTSKIIGDTIRFTNVQPLSGLSLCMGDYICKSAIVGNVISELYLFKEHEYLIKGSKNVQDILAERLKGGFRTPSYPLGKLALVEIPVHFCTYTRPWRNASEQLQPEIIFRPEAEATGRINPRFDTYQYAYEVQDTTTEWFNLYEREYISYSYNPLSQNLFLRILDKYLKNHKLQNGTNYLSLLKNHHFNMSSDEFPGINLVINILPERWEAARDNTSLNMKFPTIEYIRDHSFATAFQDLKAQPIIHQLIMYKTDQLIKHLLIDRHNEAFIPFLQQFMNHHSFQSVTFEQFCKEYQEQYGTDLRPIFRQLYLQVGLPKFLVRDIQFQALEDSKGEDITIRTFKVWNKGQADGIISISAQNPKTGDEQGFEDFLVPAGTCKEIRSSFIGRASGMNVELSTGLSQNLPDTYMYSDLPIANIMQVPELGVFDIDTMAFDPIPNEYIVDNESQGFHIINKGHKLQIIKKEEPLPRIKAFELVPDQWTRYIHAGAYGEPMRSYYCKKAGSGVASIEWKTRLPEEGEYELFTFVNYGFYEDFTKVIFIKEGEETPDEPVVPSLITQTYQFTHKNGKANVTFETNISGNGWVSLGKYYFPAGLAKVMLTDQGAYPEQCIYADAVKWVKRYK